MRMTVENLDSEISQVVKNTRKSTILHKREKVKQHPNRVLDKLKLKFTYLQATCTPASTLLTFSWHYWAFSALYSQIVHYALITLLRCLYKLALTHYRLRFLLLSVPDWQCSCRIYRCPRRNVQDFGRVYLMLKYTDINHNTYVQSWTVTEIMAREVWNFDSCYTLIDYQIHIKTGRNMWFL